MVRTWLHVLEPVNYLENLGHIDHCALFPTNPEPEKYVVGEILTIPPTKLMNAVVSCFTTQSTHTRAAAPQHTIGHGDRGVRRSSGSCSANGPGGCRIFAILLLL